LNNEREYPVLYSFCTVIVAKTDSAVELLDATPLAMVVVTTFFFFSVVVVFFASGDGAAPEELTQPTVTASARAGKTINDR
jgi:hypothetical protein